MGTSAVCKGILIDLIGHRFLITNDSNRPNVTNKPLKKSFVLFVRFSQFVAFVIDPTVG